MTRVFPEEAVGRLAVRLVRDHYECDEAAFKATAYELERLYDDEGRYEVAEYIFAQINPASAFVPM